MNVKVLDALMGSGKTTKLIKDVSLLPNNNPVIYIAPLLSECHRFAGTFLLLWRFLRQKQIFIQ